MRAGDPIPRLDHSVDAESLWPSSLEQESDHAAHILRSFFCDGFVVPYRTLGVCDQQVRAGRQVLESSDIFTQLIRNCHGLAVFRLLRHGLCSTVADGSGVLVTQSPDKKWSGTSAILIDSKSTFPRGIDVLDVMLIINDKHSMDILLDPIVALQKCLHVNPGPIPQSGGFSHSSVQALDFKGSIWSYAKSKGELAQIDLSCLVIREYTKENERFYGVEGVTGKEILLGHAKAPSGTTDHLARTVHALVKQNIDLSWLPRGRKCPGDYRVRSPPATN